MKSARARYRNRHHGGPATGTGGAPALTVVSVAAQSNINVAYGTAFGSISFVSPVVVTLSDASTRDMAVSYAQGGYSGTSTGNHDLVGTLTLPGDVTNPLNVTAAVRVVVPVHPMSIFDRIWGTSELTDSDWNSNAAALGGRLYGAAERAAQGAATTAPNLNGTTPNKKLTFDGTNDHIVQDTDAPQMSQGFEIWMLVDILNVGSTRSIWAGGGTVDFRIVSGQFQIRQGGTGQNVGAAATGKKLYRISFNGTSSFLQINKQAKVTVGATPGTTLPASDLDSIFGANFAVSANWTNMDLYEWGIKGTAMTDAQADAIFDYLGYTT